MKRNCEVNLERVEKTYGLFEFLACLKLIPDGKSEVQ